MATANKSDEVGKLCVCGNKISAWDTHPVCAACLGLSLSQAALISTQDCIHCAAFPRKLLRRRLARQASLASGDPLLGEAAVAQAEIEMPGELMAIPGPSWADADPQFIPTAFPSLDADQGCKGFPAAAGIILEGDANEGGDESADSELLLSDDDDEEDSNSMASISWAAKPPATGEVDKPAPLSPLDLNMQDMCKRAAARLNIPCPAVQTEVVKSRFDGKKFPKVKKTSKQMLPVLPELLDEIAVMWKTKPYSKKLPIAGSSLLDCEGIKTLSLPDATSGAIGGEPSSPKDFSVFVGPVPLLQGRPLPVQPHR